MTPFESWASVRPATNGGGVSRSVSQTVRSEAAPREPAARASASSPDQPSPARAEAAFRSSLAPTGAPGVAMLEGGLNACELFEASHGISSTG